MLNNELNNELVNSNHSSHQKTTGTKARDALFAARQAACDALTAARAAGVPADVLVGDALYAAGDLLSAAGEIEQFIATGEGAREVSRKLYEHRLLYAIADERWRDDCRDGSKSASVLPKCWDVRMLAKQLGVHVDTVRRWTRQGKFSFALCVTHPHCRGGTRGCDLRYIANEAHAWVIGRRGVRR